MSQITKSHLIRKNTHVVHELAIFMDQPAIWVNSASITPGLDEGHEVLPPCLDVGLPAITARDFGKVWSLWEDSGPGVAGLILQPRGDLWEHSVALDFPGDYGIEGTGHALLCKTHGITPEVLHAFLLIFHHSPGQQGADVGDHTVWRFPHHVVRCLPGQAEAIHRFHN